MGEMNTMAGGNELTIELFTARPGRTEELLASHILPLLRAEKTCALCSRAMMVVPSVRMAANARKILLGELGAGSFGQSALTLNRLFGLLMRKCSAGSVLPDAARLAIIEDVLKSNAPRLRFLSSAHGYPGVVRKLSEVFSTIKQNNIFEPERLEDLLRAGSRNRDIPADKISDLLLLFTEYVKRMRGEGAASSPLLDEEDALERIRLCLSENGMRGLFPELDLIVFHGFYDFNPLQREVLKPILRTVPRALFSLEIEPEGAGSEWRRNRLFMLPDKTLRFLSACSETVHIKRIDRDEDKNLAPSMRKVAPLLFESRSVTREKADARQGVIVLNPHDPASEVVEIARRIKRIAGGSNPPPLSEIAVVFPDIEAWTPLVTRTFNEYGIPYEISAGHLLASAPACAAIIDMLDASASRFAREQVFRFLSSPFVRMPPGASATAHEIDMVAREAAIAGGTGPSEWFVAFEAHKSKLKYLEERKRHSTEADSAQLERCADRLAQLEGCKKAVRSVFELMSPLEPDRKIAPAEFNRFVNELISEFGIRRSACAIPAEFVSPADARRNLRALEAFDVMMSELRLGLELTSRGTTGERTVRELIDLVKSSIYNVRYNDSPKVRGGVRVMSPLETRGMSFHTVFLGGMIDDAFPKRNEHDFFLSADERAACGLESIRTDVSEDRLLFYRLFRVTGNQLIISYPKWVSESEAVPSVFVDEIKSRLEQGEDELISNGDTYLYSQADCLHKFGGIARTGEPVDLVKVEHFVRAIPEVRILETARAIDVENSRGTAMGNGEYRGQISNEFHLKFIRGTFEPPHNTTTVTRIEKYARCPFGYFLRHLLGIEPMADVDEEISPPERGELLHDIFETFYRSRYDASMSKVIPVSIAPDAASAAEGQILEIAISKLEGFAYRGMFWNAFRDSLLAGLQGYVPKLPGSVQGTLKTFIEREAADIDWCKPRYFESEFTAKEDAPPQDTDPVKLYGKALKVQIDDLLTIYVRGKIDRIDVLEGDKPLFFIVDYKTGIMPSPKDLRRGMLAGTELQLPIYLLFARRALGKDFTPIGAALYSVARDPMRFGKAAFFAKKDFRDSKTTGSKPINTRMTSGFFADEEFLSIVIAARDSVMNSIRSILAGRFDIELLKEDVDKCSYCDVGRICRHNAEAVSAAADTGNEGGAQIDK